MENINPRKNKKQVLINGCSFSRGPTAWPYYLEDFNIVNLAQAGAGNTYIHESTIDELAKRTYDLVVIMWTGLARVDFKVEDISVFNSSKYTSRYQKTRNDWEGKIIFPVNDQDYVDDNWVFGCGGVNQENALTKTNLFNGIYKHLSHTQFVYHSLMKMISLQSFLKAHNIPYVFTFYNDYLADLQNEAHLYKFLDQSNMLVSDNIYSIATKLKDFPNLKD